jgi:hypothetical protein
MRLGSASVGKLRQIIGRIRTYDGYSNYQLLLVFINVFMFFRSIGKRLAFFVIKAFENVPRGYPTPCGNCSTGFQYPSAYVKRVLATSEKIYIIFESC